MSQLFKKIFDDEIKEYLINFIKKYCKCGEVESGLGWNLEMLFCATFNKESYKKAQIDNAVEEFYNKFKPYYHVSKRFYIEDRIDSYRKIAAVLRQICRANKFSFTSQVNYIKSKHNTSYIISFPKEEEAKLFNNQNHD